MTQSLFYSAAATGVVAHSVITLDASASAHAIRSQRLGVDDHVLVSDGNGTLAEGVISVADPQGASVRIEAVTTRRPPDVVINLVQALAKGDRDLLAAEMATEVGVDCVTPWQARRSIVRLRPERAAKTLAKWESKLAAAAQQARRSYIPALGEPLVSEEIATLHAPQDGAHVVVLHEDGDHNMSDVVSALDGIKTVHLVVGPEGGVAPQELEAVTAAGGTTLKIGSNVMRASTAGPVALALLNQALNRW